MGISQSFDTNKQSNKSNKSNQPNKKQKHNYIDLIPNNNLHKLGQNPNSLSIFKKKLKKEHNEITINQEIKTDNKMDNKQIHVNINVDFLENNHLNNHLNNNNYNNVQIHEPITLKKDILINDNNYDDVQIHEPIALKKNILINDDEDDFEIFKQSILSDESIDNDMKQILIQSRKEQLDKIELKSKQNIEKAIRLNIISPLITKLKDNTCFELNNEQKKYIINQISRWTDGTIQKIKLESETLYALIEIIVIVKSTRVDMDDVKIKKIFEPKNQSDYLSYVDMIEEIKTQSIKEEQERINKKIEKAKLEEENNKAKMEKIKFREEITRELIMNLYRLGSIDAETKILKSNLVLPLDKFIKLEIEYIEMSQELFLQTQKFINSIRITKENKENILKSIKILSNV